MGEAKSRQKETAKEPKPQPEGKPFAVSQVERLALLRFMRAPSDAGGAKQAESYDERRRRRRARRAFRISTEHVETIRTGNGESTSFGRRVGDDADERFDSEKRQTGRRLYFVTEDVRDYVIAQLERAAMPEQLGEVLVDLEDRLRDLKDGRYVAPNVPAAGGDDDFIPRDTAVVSFPVTVAELAEIQRTADGADIGGVVRVALGLPAALPEPGQASKIADDHDADGPDSKEP